MDSLTLARRITFAFQRPTVGRRKLRRNSELRWRTKQFTYIRGCAPNCGDVSWRRKDGLGFLQKLFQRNSENAPELILIRWHVLSGPGSPIWFLCPFSVLIEDRLWRTRKLSGWICDLGLYSRMPLGPSWPSTGRKFTNRNTRTKFTRRYSQRLGWRRRRNWRRRCASKTATDPPRRLPSSEQPASQVPRGATEVATYSVGAHPVVGSRPQTAPGPDCPL